MLRIRDHCPMFLTAVLLSRDRGGVKIVFVLLKDHNLKKKGENTSYISRELRML